MALAIKQLIVNSAIIPDGSQVSSYLVTSGFTLNKSVVFASAQYQASNTNQTHYNVGTYLDQPAGRVRFFRTGNVGQVTIYFAFIEFESTSSINIYHGSSTLGAVDTDITLPASCPTNQSFPIVSLRGGTFTDPLYYLVRAYQTSATNLRLNNPGASTFNTCYWQVATSPDFTVEPKLGSLTGTFANVPITSSDRTKTFIILIN